MEIRQMTEDDLRQMQEEHISLNPDLKIRDDIKESLDAWANNGFMPGDFLKAVLENDLMKAMGLADSYNRATMFQICSYIYNKLPGPCHGSREIMNDWAERFEEES